MTDAIEAAKRILGNDNGGASTGFFDSHDPAIVARALLEVERGAEFERIDLNKALDRAEKAEADAKLWQDSWNETIQWGKRKEAERDALAKALGDIEDGNYGLEGPQEFARRALALLDNPAEHFPGCTFPVGDHTPSCQKHFRALSMVIGDRPPAKGCGKQVGNSIHACGEDGYFHAECVV